MLFLIWCIISVIVGPVYDGSQFKVYFFQLISYNKGSFMEQNTGCYVSGAWQSNERRVPQVHASEYAAVHDNCAHGDHFHGDHEVIMYALTYSLIVLISRITSPMFSYLYHSWSLPIHSDIHGSQL